MSQLLAVTVGPVQGFIQAARRTRDLWSGSRLISEISKSVAKLLHTRSGGGLIFPYPEQPETELEPDSDYLVSNVLVVELPDASDAGRVAEEAEAAAQAAWERYALEALATAGNAVEERRFRYQMRSVVECYAAWSRIDEEGYAAARRRVMGGLAARKACRDFSAWNGEALVPKSSLDGARESVWRDGEAVDRLPRRLRGQVRPSRGEQLDCVGLTKRLGMGNRQFPSVARVAADGWLRRLTEEQRERLRAAAEPLCEGGLVRLNRFRQFAAFPYEGAILYPTRVDEIETEGAVMERWKTVLRQVIREAGEASPYVAVLVADGDRMGKTISGIEDVRRHRAFSRALAGFAREAERIVGEQYGALVFAGGDDVLALLPADRAIACAEALQVAFLAAMEGWEGPTLSVGIGIGHAMEDLEDLLEASRQAERMAKSHAEKNSLAVSYSPRRQNGRAVRRSWREDPAAEYREMVAHFQAGFIPTKAAYQLAAMAEHYAGWGTDSNLLAAMRADAGRLFSRKRGRWTEGETWERWWRDLLDRRLQRPGDLHELANQLVIARHLAEIGGGRHA